MGLVGGGNERGKAGEVRHGGEQRDRWTVKADSRTQRCWWSAPRDDHVGKYRICTHQGRWWWVRRGHRTTRVAQHTPCEAVVGHEGLAGHGY